MACGHLRLSFEDDLRAAHEQRSGMEVAFGQVDARAAFTPGAERDDEGVDAARKTKPLLLGIAPGDELLREEPGRGVGRTGEIRQCGDGEAGDGGVMCIFHVFSFFGRTQI